MRILFSLAVIIASGAAACSDDSSCKTNADCPQGRICRVGLCALDPNGSDGLSDGETIGEVTLNCDPAQPGDLVLNEILADPPAGADVDGNGSPSSSGDEFVEVVNVSSREVALSNVQLDVGGKRVALGQLCLPPNTARVMFGSGGLPTLTNTSGRVGLIVDAVEVQAHAYGSEGGRDSSMTLAKQLDPSSAWVLQKDVWSTPYSPGMCSNGNAFPDCEGGVIGPDADVVVGDLGELPPLECEQAPVTGDLLINEVLADPGTGATGQDANGDGVVSSNDDEFVEIVNVSNTTLLLRGVTLHDGSTKSYSFPAICVAPEQAIVVFGAYTGTGNFAGVIALSGGGLSLNNGGDSVILRNAAGDVLETMTYGSEADADQSIVRSTDLDATASFVKHSLAPNAGGARMSPGRCQNGNAFPDCAGAPEVVESVEVIEPAEVVEDTSSETFETAQDTEVSEVADTSDVQEEVGPSCGPTPVAGDLVLNEVLFDPTDFDANGDGVVSTTDDEFVELVNVSGGALNLQGVAVGDTTSANNFTFGAGACIEAGEAIVVFGKGTQRFTASGMVVIDDAKHGLSLNNSPPELVRITSGGVEIINVPFTSIPSKQSSARSPELTGAFTPHKAVGGGAAASPGKCVNGVPFPACAAPL